MTNPDTARRHGPTLARIEAFLGHLPERLTAARAASAKLAQNRPSANNSEYRTARSDIAEQLAAFAESDKAKVPAEVNRRIVEAVSLDAASQQLFDVYNVAAEKLARRTHRAFTECRDELYDAIRARVDSALAEIRQVAPSVPAGMDDSEAFRAPADVTEAYKRLDTAAATVEQAIEVVRAIIAAGFDHAEADYGLAGGIVVSPDLDRIPPHATMRSMLHSLALDGASLSFADPAEFEDRMSKAAERQRKAKQDAQLTYAKSRGLAHL